MSGNEPSVKDFCHASDRPMPIGTPTIADQSVARDQKAYLGCMVQRWLYAATWRTLANAGEDLHSQSFSLL